jgi:hypothetical protein
MENEDSNKLIKQLNQFGSGSKSILVLEDLESYNVITSYFKNKETGKLTIDDITIGAHYVYAWMPTMLKSFNCTNESLELWNKAHNLQNRLDNEDIKKLKPTINNSIVGLSKLLHVVNPEIYPIIDSRVIEYFNTYQNNTAFKKFGTTNNTLANQYCAYQKLCDDTIKKKEDWIPIRRKYFDMTDTDKTNGLTDIRAIELIMYSIVKLGQ